MHQVWTSGQPDVHQFCLKRKLQFVWELVDEVQLCKMQRSFLSANQQSFNVHTTGERGQGPIPMHQVWISGHPCPTFASRRIHSLPWEIGS
jgi:hypothetical protein